MQKPLITKDVIFFLKELKNNNTREWFAENKKEFKEIEAKVKVFYNHISDELKTHDKIERIKMFRIYRDVRFSKDKTPYQPHFAGSFSRAGAKLRGGYYLRIRPGESFIATGFWAPNKEDILRIRKEFELDSTDFRAVINDKHFKSIWGALKGDALKTAPKGFDKEDPNIDLIRRKQFIFSKELTDKEVLSPEFITNVSTAFKATRPYFDLMSDILTTDLNGESLLDH